MYELHRLPEIDFSIKNITIQKETWPDGAYFDYTSRGRSQNLIHLITEGSRFYRIGDETLHLSAGELLLIPDSTRYYTSSCSGCSGIGICFDLYTTEGAIPIRPDIYHDWPDWYGEYASIIHEMSNTISEGHCGHLHKKALFWLLLDKMISHMETRSALSRMMTPALRHLNLHYRENEPVSVYASACGLSESHFRRKFLEYTGMTPVEYRDSLRFEEARQLYARGLSMVKIAEQVGFCDASYLRRLYRKRTGSHFREYRPPEIT